MMLKTIREKVVAVAKLEKRPAETLKPETISVPPPPYIASVTHVPHVPIVPPEYGQYVLPRPNIQAFLPV